MPKIAKEYERTVRGHIRRLLIMDGTMTDLEITKQLNKIGIPFKIDYIRDQRRKIIKEKMQRGLSETLTTYLQNFVDTLSEADRRLWQIATDPKAKHGDRIYAMSQIRENRKAVFEKLFEAGLFERQLGNLNLTTFMDIVKDASKVKDAEAITTTGIRESPRALENKPGGSNPSPMGAGLADLVRASADPSIGSQEQKDGG